MMIMASAAMMVVQSVGASAAPVGISSNRAALGLPVAAVDTCTTVAGRASCAPANSSQLAGGVSIVVLLLALAAIGAGIYIAADEDTSPNSP